MKITNIILVDDHPAIAYGTKTILEQNLNYRVVEILTDVSQVTDALLHHHPQIVMVDMNMPIMNGRELTSLIKSVAPRTQVIIFSGFDLMPMWNQLNRVGVSGILSKNATPQQIMRMVASVLDGETIIPIAMMQHLVFDGYSANLLQTVELTERELKIMHMIFNGMSNRQISEELIVSTRSAENYIARIYSKLGVKSRSEAIEEYRSRYLGMN